LPNKRIALFHKKAALKEGYHREGKKGNALLASGWAFKKPGYPLK
jgi:hypothetical protein